MNRRFRLAIGLVCALWMAQGTMAQAQFFGFPGGFGGCGWGGWGVGTPDGDLAQGMGTFAMGLGFYEEKAAIARSIDTDTMMRFNEYMHETQMTANRMRLAREARQRESNRNNLDAIQKRLRDNPEPRDVIRGDALNVALDEIDDPRVYTRALKGAKVSVGADRIRRIPFRYAAAAITVGLHQLATGNVPAPLQRPEFAADLEAIRALDKEILAQVEDDKEPDPATVQKLLAAIYAAEEKAGKSLSTGLERTQAEKFLKALHGLVVMLKTPAIDNFVAGVDKRPDATLGELLRFMKAFNLRFGAATTPQQQEVYRFLFPQLAQLRDEVAGALASTAPHPTNGTAVEDFFSGMSLDDLQKKAPKP
jgi:hypothetical protein